MAASHGRFCAGTSDSVVQTGRMSATAESTMDEVRRIADEIRVRIHLAGMDLKDAWAKLEPKVHEFEHKFEQVTAKAGTEIDGVVGKLREELQGLHERLFRS